MPLRRKARDEELKVAVVQATTEELRSSLCSRTSKLHKDLSLAKKLGLGAGEDLPPCCARHTLACFPCGERPSRRIIILITICSLG